MFDVTYGKKNFENFYYPLILNEKGSVTRSEIGSPIFLSLGDNKGDRPALRCQFFLQRLWLARRTLPPLVTEHPEHLTRFDSTDQTRKGTTMTWCLDLGIWNMDEEI